MKFSTVLYTLGFASIAISASNYLKSQNADNERDGLFTGHWAPTFFILAKVVEDREKRSSN